MLKTQMLLMHLMLKFPSHLNNPQARIRQTKYRSESQPVSGKNAFILSAKHSNITSIPERTRWLIKKKMYLVTP